MIKYYLNEVDKRVQMMFLFLQSANQKKVYHGKALKR